ncbi:MAG: nitroreductase/quinone reductase family protein [Candidatus Limnocylindria bacterium]
MATEPAFDQEILDQLQAIEEVDIETTRRSGDVRSTIIWVVAEGSDVFVRSVRGERGRWYQDLVARPAGHLRLGQESIAVRAIPATDDATVGHVSELLEAKYGTRHRASTDSMLQPETLSTTLRLEPG